MKKNRKNRNKDGWMLIDYDGGSSLEVRHVTLVFAWAAENGVESVYENNAYDIKHKCERDIGEYVSQDDIAKAYRKLGYRVERITSNKYLDGYCWKIWDLKC